jgi:uncharacterized protein (DUF1697 family)
MVYVALLRGINVGGNNLIKMADLKACFEDQGFRRVSTYIQSGNVVFEAGAAGQAGLTRRIEGALAGTFDYPASVVLRSRTQMEAIVGRAPEGFGARPARFRYDVVFLKEPLDARTAAKGVPTRPGVDQVAPGRGVLYFSRLIREASRSLLSRIVSMPAYRSMTIRNWNTTTRLLHLMRAAEERGGPPPAPGR